MVTLIQKFTLVLLIFPLSILGQQVEFETAIKNFHGQYHQPLGFVKVPDDPYFFYYENDENLPESKRKYIRTFYQRIINSDSSILLGFIIYPIDTALDKSNVLQKMFPGRKANTEYLLSIRHKIGDDLSRVIYLPSSRSKRKFGAELVGRYSLRTTKKYLDKFNWCTILFIHKENILDAECYFFHERKSNEQVEQLIRKAYRILSFK